MGAWKVFVELALPPPLILLTLLLLPSPSRAWTRFLLRTVDRTLGLTVLGTLQLVHVMIALSGAAALGSVRDAAAAARTKGSSFEISLSASATVSAAAKRWRSERNAWVSSFALVVWCILARVYALSKRLADLEEERETRLAAAPAAAFRAAASSAGKGGGGNGGKGASVGKGGGGEGESSTAPSAPPLTRANSGSGKKKQ